MKEYNGLVNLNYPDKPYCIYTMYSEDEIDKNIYIGRVSTNKDRKHSDETKQIISLKNKERKDRGWVNPRKKKVYKYNKDRVLLVTYSCLQEAGTKENVSPTSIGEWCRQQKRPSNNFIWSYVKLV
jgi:hypothetical protein